MSWLLMSSCSVIGQCSNPRRWIRNGLLSDTLYIGYLCLEECDLGNEYLGSSLLANSLDADLVFIINRKNPPENGVRFDGDVSSFVCSLGVIRCLIDRKELDSTELTAFSVGLAAINSDVAIRIGCLQVPIVKALGRTPNHKAEWIIPHRGSLQYLRTSLISVRNVAEDNDQVSVCFDEEVTDQHHYITGEFPCFRFFRSSPHHNGPYVAREVLSSRSEGDVIIFQDSDDISCVGRRSSLLAEMERCELDLIGSHELRIDEIDQRVIAIRYPLDVSRALSVTASHPLLHPSSAVKRESLKKTGGFSTHRKYGSDTEFLLRAHFFLKIGNANEFLYIRRRRQGSLTTSTDTALDSPQRLELDRLWKEDFIKIKSGNLLLSESSLSQVHRDDISTIDLTQLTHRGTCPNQKS